VGGGRGGEGEVHVIWAARPRFIQGTETHIHMHIYVSP
jgi:hypothetical protein